MDIIQLTPEAVTYIKKILHQHTEAVGIRIGVKNSGCSGLSYIFDLALNHPVDDSMYQCVIEGIPVLIDKNSIDYLKGAEIYCVQEGLNEYIKFNNPNVKGACGCGESFSVQKN